jgi:hypothetical protein
MKNKLLLHITAASLLSFPILTFAQAPILGTAAGFVLFSSNGAVSNTGISQLTGNIGTNNGSSTAFGNVNGVMHDNDAASGPTCSLRTTSSMQLYRIIPTRRSSATAKCWLKAHTRSQAHQR